jgi:hypothetical protein
MAWSDGKRDPEIGRSRPNDMLGMQSFANDSFAGFDEQDKVTCNRLSGQIRGLMHGFPTETLALCLACYKFRLVNKLVLMLDKSCGRMIWERVLDGMELFARDSFFLPRHASHNIRVWTILHAISNGKSAILCHTVSTAPDVWESLMTVVAFHPYHALPFCHLTSLASLTEASVFDDKIGDPGIRRPKHSPGRDFLLVAEVRGVSRHEIYSTAKKNVALFGDTVRRDLRSFVDPFLKTIFLTNIVIEYL